MIKFTKRFYWNNKWRARKIYYDFTQQLFNFKYYTQINRVRKLFNDELSKNTLDAFYQLKMHNNVNPMLNVTRPAHMQYFDESVIKPKRKSVFVEMGALDGATSLQFVEWTNNDYESIWCFEPDELSCNRSMVAMAHLKNVTIFQEGVSDNCGVSNFASLGTGGSHFSEESEMKVKVTTLDSKVRQYNFVPTIIKMDIEGAEKAALIGSSETIMKHKPVLMVSAYHKICDVYELPFFIKKTYPDYRLYLRHYDFRDYFKDISPETSETHAMHFELVLYAIPKNYANMK